MSDEDSAHPAGRRRSLLWIGAMAVIAIAVIGGALYLRHQLQQTESRLMAARADQVPQDAELYAFARNAGERVYAQNCVSCHGANLQGDPTRGVPKLSDDDWLYGGGLMSDLERTISHGIRSGDPKAWNLADMPAYSSADPHSVDADERLPHLESQEIYDLADFILRREKQPHDAAAAERGSRLFHGKAICFDCHTDSAQGDPSTGVPNLADATWLYGSGSKADIVDSVAQGRRATCPAWLDKLGALKVRAVAAYVKSRSKQSPFAIRPEDLTPRLPNEIPPPPTPGEEEPAPT